MRHPPVPPRVSQIYALLPDGSRDPANTTDCGEACCVAAWAAYGGLRIPPGCARQALGLSPDNGSTEATDLSRFFGGVGLSSQRHSYAPARHRELLEACGRRGHLVAVLGYWQGRAELHWILGYGAHDRTEWYMDPWVAEYVQWPWGEARGLAVGVAVEIWV